jgi:hypothetical protein
MPLAGAALRTPAFAGALRVGVDFFSGKHASRVFDKAAAKLPDFGGAA